MSFEIVTDSSANLPNHIIDEHRIHVLSLSFIVGGQEYKSYIKGQENDLAKFYVMMRNGETITTSCVDPVTVQELIEPLLVAGKDLLYMGFSSRLSATYDVVCNVLNQLKLKYSERTIITIDTLAASLGQGLIVKYASLLREEGKNIFEVSKWVENNICHICHWFTVEDLKYLRRGGRISAAKALIGDVLQVKPIMHMDDNGQLIPVDKVRGKTRSLDALVDKMKESYLGLKQIIYIAHADCLERAEYLQAKIKEFYQAEEIMIHQIDPVIGAHVGPGTASIYFLGKQR